MSKVKILVVGPTKSGKSTVTNQIADIQDGIEESYRPTKALRIVELEKEAPLSVKRQFPGVVTVEMWDLSGDPMYEKTWPAVMKGAQGILFVYRPDDHDVEKNMEFYINSFAKAAKILPKQCMAFAHHFDCEGEPGKSKILNCFKGVPITDCSAENSSTVVPSFEKYFSHLMGILGEKQEKEEKMMMEG